MTKWGFAPNLDKEFAKQKKARAKARKQLKKDTAKARRRMLHPK